MPQLRTIEWGGRQFGLGSLGPDIPDLRDKRLPRSFLRATLGVGVPPIAFVHSTPLHDQGAQGSCVGQSVAKMLEVQATKEVAFREGKEFYEVAPVQLARAWAYALGRAAINTLPVDSGCHCRDVIKGIAKHGVPSEALVPYEEGELYTSFDDWAKQNALLHKIEGYYNLKSVDEIRAALSAHHPVSFAQPIYSGYERTTGEFGYFPVPRGSLLGAHQTTIVAYDDNHQTPDWLTKGAFLVENSWGAGHGIDNPFTETEGGHYWFPYEAAMNSDLCYDIWTVHTIPLI